MAEKKPDFVYVKIDKRNAWIIWIVIKIASLACTVVLTQKLFKAHAAALRDESSCQPSVIIGSVGSVVEMTPAYEKA